MVKTTAELITLSVQVGILLVICGFFLYRRIMLKIRSLEWFIWIFVLGVLQAVYEIIFWILINNGYPQLEKYNDSHFIIYGLALLVLFIFLEVLEHDKPRFLSSTIAISLWLIFVTLYCYDSYFGVQQVERFEDHLSSYFFDVFQIVVMFQALLVFYRIYRKAKLPRLKLLSALFFFAFIILEIIAILELTEHWVDWEIPNAIFFTVAFLYIALIYLIFPYYVYLVPYDVYNLILINSSGLVIYSCRLGQEEPESSALLMGGVVSGLEQFLRSFFNTQNRLKRIDMEDKTLLMESYSNLSIMAIVQKSSYILKNAMSQLVKEVLQKFPELEQDKSQVVIDTEKTTVINQIIARVFPFIPSEDVFPIQTSTKDSPEIYSKKQEECAPVQEVKFTSDLEAFTLSTTQESNILSPQDDENNPSKNDKNGFKNEVDIIVDSHESDDNSPNPQ